MDKLLKKLAERKNTEADNSQELDEFVAFGRNELPKTQKFCLFEGRHELPQNLGEICTGFNFATFTAEKSPLWEEALRAEDCEIYVTGLTPALTQFIAEWAKANIHTKEENYGGETYHSVDFESSRLALFHYNQSEKNYVCQVLFGAIISNDEYMEMIEAESREDFYRD